MKAKKIIQNNGVTLTSLVISIIIMLILTTASIVIIHRENLISNARNAAIIYQIEQDREVIGLAYQRYMLSDVDGKEKQELEVDGAQTDGDEESGWNVQMEDGNKFTMDSEGNIKYAGNTGEHNEYYPTAGVDVSATTAQASDVLQGKFFYDAEGNLVEGTIPNNQGISKTIERYDEKVEIPAGYTTGGTVDVNSTNIKEENIKNGVSILGVTGKYHNETTTANEGDVLTGKSFYNAEDRFTQGTMPNNGSVGGTINSLNEKITINAGYTTGGSVDVNKTNITADNIRSGKSILGVNGTFTNDANAGNYDIVKGQTAYVNGSKVTGSYEAYNKQLNSSSTSCSTTALKFNCSFKPTYVSIVYNHGAYDNNKVIACWAAEDAIVYHTKTSSGIVRTQITNGVSSYWSYSNGMVTVNRPSSYTWSSNNYRVFAFK